MLFIDVYYKHFGCKQHGVMHQKEFPSTQYGKHEYDAALKRLEHKYYFMIKEGTAHITSGEIKSPHIDEFKLEERLIFNDASCRRRDAQ